MLYAPTRSAALDTKTREALAKVKRSVAIVQNSGGKRTTNHKGRITRQFMAKQNVTPEYYEALQKFAARLETDQQRVLDEAGDSDAVVKVVIDTGRKFDKIMLATIRRDKSSKAPEVKYFVDRSNGAIYGPKSPLAPNLKWYFGVVENADKWDWSGQYGVNVSDESVKEVGKYGTYTHYEPVAEREAVAS